MDKKLRIEFVNMRTGEIEFQHTVSRANVSQGGVCVSDGHVARTRGVLANLFWLMLDKAESSCDSYQVRFTLSAPDGLELDLFDESVLKRYLRDVHKAALDS